MNSHDSSMDHQPRLDDLVVPAVANQEDLLTFHTELLSRADLDAKFAKGAEVVAELSSLLEGFPAADPRVVNLVVAEVASGMTASCSSDFARFNVARGWIDNLRIQKRALDVPKRTQT